MALFGGGPFLADGFYTVFAVLQETDIGGQYLSETSVQFKLDATKPTVTFLDKGLNRSRKGFMRISFAVRDLLSQEIVRQSGLDQ